MKIAMKIIFHPAYPSDVHPTVREAFIIITNTNCNYLTLKRNFSISNKIANLRRLFASMKIKQKLLWDIKIETRAYNERG